MTLTRATTAYVAITFACALLVAGSAHARVETLRWGHADVEGEGVVGFRLYEKPTGTNTWTKVTELPVTALDSPASSVYVHEVQVADGAVITFALQAYGDAAESGFSNDRVFYPPSSAGNPSGDFLADFDFANASQEPAGWIDTAANNSLSIDSSLFGPDVVAGNGVLATSSTATNIHSHLAMAQPDEWVDYEYSGRMMTSGSSSSLGVTAYSEYPQRDAYYRVRAERGGSFHLSPHPDGAFSMACTSADTGVNLATGQWYRFRIQVQTESSHTSVLAKVWQDGQAEPSNWAIDCLHQESDRLTGGTVGVWAMGSGEKYWDDISVERLGGTGETPTPVPPPVPAALEPPVLLE